MCPSDQEIVKEVVADYLCDGVELLSVHEHWSAEGVDEDALRAIHSEANRILLALIGKISEV